MADTTTAASPLRRRLIDDMMLRNLSPATQRSYLDTRNNHDFADVIGSFAEIAARDAI